MFATLSEGIRGCSPSRRVKDRQATGETSGTLKRLPGSPTWDGTTLWRVCRSNVPCLRVSNATPSADPTFGRPVTPGDGTPYGSGNALEDRINGNR